MILQYPKNLVHYSGIDQIVESEEKDQFYRAMILNLILGFTRRRRFRHAIRVNGRRLNLQEDAVLIAHGSPGKRGTKIWRYYDEPRKKREHVQNWIDSVDGEYRVLFLHVCNCRSLEIKSERSLVIHADHRFSLGDMLSNQVNLRIYVPEKGYLENNYQELRMRGNPFRTRS
jgi:hypothetical protein